MKKLFVGIDWGSKVHAVCVVDAAGEVVLQEEVAHRGDSVLDFLERLLKLAGGDVSRLVAAMESPHGVMVEALLERGIDAYALNPKQLDRFRDRHSSAGAKDDDLDAFVLATSLRTDLRLFRAISLPTEARLELTGLSRSYETLTEQVVGLANQVRELLCRYYPQMLELGTWHDEPWLWELFALAPTPARARSTKLHRVETILKKHRIRRHTAEEVLASLQQTALPVARGVPEALAKRIAKLLPVLRVAHEQRTLCSREMKALFAQFAEEADSPEQMHHDAVLLQSLPGIGIHNGAVMLAEAATALHERDYQALRRLAGVAPVSRRTGGRSQRPSVLQRQACSRRLREAVYHWARVAAQNEPRARAQYTELRARGHSHGRAIRGVADRLLKVLCAVLTSRAPYCAERRSHEKKTPLAA